MSTVTATSLSVNDFDPENVTVTAALECVARGWPVVLLHGIAKGGACSCPNVKCSAPGKHPNAKACPQGVKNATTDPGTVRDWFHRFPTANYGIATGSASGLYALDFDNRKGGETALAAVLRDYSELGKTFTQKTGGGFHFLFTAPEGVPPPRSNAGEGMDVRGEGSYVVGYGSLHHSGNRYELLVNATPVPFPRGLAEAAHSRAPAITVTGDSTGVVGEITVNRNVRLTQLAGKARRMGIEHPELVALLRAANRHRCVPPLEDSEVDRIALSVSRYSPSAPELLRPEFIEEDFDEQEWAKASRTYRQMVAEPKPMPRSLVGTGLFVEGFSSYIAGHPGYGKSFLSLGLAVALQTGDGWLGLPTVPARVGVITLEVPEQIVRTRLEAVARRAGASNDAWRDTQFLCRPNVSMVDLSSPSGLTRYRRWAEAHGLEFVIIDPLSRIHALDENNNQQVGEFLRAIERVWIDCGFHQHTLAHMRKNAQGQGDDVSQHSMRGFGKALGDSTANLTLTNVKVEKGADAIRLLHFDKVNFGPEPEDVFLMKHREDGTLSQVDRDHAAAVRAKPTWRAEMMDFIRLRGDWVATPELEEAFGKSKRSILNFLAEHEALIERRPGGGRTPDHYRLRPVSG